MGKDEHLVSPLRQSAQQVLQARVIAESLADVHKAIHVSWTKHEAAAKLKRIFLYPVLAMSCSLGSSAGGGVVTAKEVKDICTLQLGSTIRLALFINEQREVDARLLAELMRKVGVAQADSGQGRAPVADFVGVYAQLRDVLAAEDSTVMPQKHDDGRPVGPQGAKPALLAL